MKPVCRFAAALLVFLGAFNAPAAPYPTEPQLRSAIAEAATLVKSEGLEVEILDAQKEGIARPLMAAGLSLSDRVCLVFFNTRPTAALSHFFESVQEKDLPVWLNAIAVHEVMHCIEQREAYIHRRFEKVLPPGFTRETVTLQGYTSVVKSGAVEIWGEALADIAAVLYFRQAVPAQWRRFANGLAGMRDDLARIHPVHNTGKWLHKMIAADADKAPNQNLFEAAFQLRRQFRPE